MQLGMIGLGRMGANIVRRLMRDGHSCVVYDVSPDAVAALVAEGATGSSSLDDFVARLDVPRRAWIMVPAGEITESTVTRARRPPGRRRHDHRRRQLLLPGRHPPRGRARSAGASATSTAARAAACSASSAGSASWSAARTTRSPSSSRSSRRWRPASRRRSERRGRDGEPAPEERGYLHCGPAGAGHFVKMVHNGIEYGMMAALAEGLNILHGADAGLRQRDKDAETAPLDHPEFYSYTLDIPAITEVWRRGSVVESWLLDLTAAALQESPGARRLRRPGLRLGRGAVDGDRGDRGGRAGRRAHRRALLAVLLPRRGAVREQGAVGDAQAVRRAPREAGRLSPQVAP